MFAHAALGALLCSTFLSGAAHAEEASGDWRFRGSLYGYFPDLSSTASLPTGASDIDVEAGDLIDHTDAAFMGLFEVQHGRFGVFADYLYYRIGNSVTDATQVSVGGGMPLPPGVTVDGELQVKMWVFTLAGTYRAFESDSTAIDVFAGARVLQLDTNFDYAFNTDFGPFSGPARTGSTGASSDNVDAIIGAKGRTNFGADRQWFVTYYGDVGAGDSDLTWQAFAGAGRSFGNVDVTVGYRHLDYDFSDSRIQDISFDGPVVGASVNW
ncbi:MAG TPA: hypothetical protein VG841_14975 [Caulobacterales bacterium]|nr:hypothetical protein [Caulobacterales bacterium]